ncbi:hypothetical protein GE061_012584 [Apolygus lucorum]|uniref:Uncharacterized protein n=1 Tax=Apolygus lucorum TaxID=248454 RepID=A0A8S9XVF5_APOLU|nr:hypothetical protein GE061_012584 [Apolygus lucorum]
MWSSCWLLIVMLVGNVIVSKEAQEISNQSRVTQGEKPFPYEPKEDSKRLGKERDLSRIENMLNQLGENVCNRLNRFSGSDGCRSYGGYEGDCSNWMKGNQRNYDGGKLEDYFDILRKEIGGLKTEIASCCQASKVKQVVRRKGGFGTGNDVTGTSAPCLETALGSEAVTSSSLTSEPLTSLPLTSEPLN